MPRTLIFRPQTLSHRVGALVASALLSILIGGSQVTFAQDAAPSSDAKSCPIHAVAKRVDSGSNSVLTLSDLRYKCKNTFIGVGVAYETVKTETGEKAYDLSEKQATELCEKWSTGLPFAVGRITTSSAFSLWFGSPNTSTFAVTRPDNSFLHVLPVKSSPSTRILEKVECILTLPKASS